MTKKLEERLSRRRTGPCPSCGGLHYLAGRVGFEHMTGSGGHYFDLVVCRGCGKTDLFVDEEQADDWVTQRLGPDEIVTFSVAPNKPVSARRDP